MTKLINGIDIAKLKRASELKGRISDFFTPDEILQFALNYDCPHYILIHPITKEEIILFIPTEVQEWFVSRYIQQNKCIVPQSIIISNFDYDECRITTSDIVPKELVEMIGLYHLPESVRHSPPGIYFLCQKFTIVYVGQSITPSHRVQSHRNENDKQFDRAYFIPCHIKSLDIIESALIRLLQPQYNIKMPKIYSQEDKKVLQQLGIVA